MANIMGLSKRPADLLADASQQQQHSAAVQHATEGMRALHLPHHNIAEAPRAAASVVGHELAGVESRRAPTVASIVEERRMTGGRPAAEQFINELHAASQINRGPPGFSHSSRLHFDMLLGNDERVLPADYLNFDFGAHW